MPNRKGEDFAISTYGWILWVILGLLVAIAIAVTLANKGLFSRLDFIGLR